jgi:hypothetical protein
MADALPLLVEAAALTMETETPEMDDEEARGSRRVLLESVRPSHVPRVMWSSRHVMWSSRRCGQ